VDLLEALLLAPFIILTFCLAVELFVGLRPGRRPLAGSVQGNAVILIPAHNEEAIIGTSLAVLKAAAGERTRILVVADNCDDRTAQVARESGVEVVERFDPARRGKGFALDFAREMLRREPADVVIVLDADCRTDSDSLGNLVAACTATGRPCQGVNLQTPALAGSPAVQVSTFAFFIKNVVRQRALQKLAGRAHLLGTGMAFPWQIFDRAALATDHVAEDLQIGIELAEKGHPPLFIEDAIVWSDPETEKNTLVQRQRWEGGFLQNALKSGPAILRRSLGAGDLPGVWAAINLMIPPLALLVALDLAALLTGVLLSWLAGATTRPSLLLAAALLLVFLGLAVAWTMGGRRFVTLGSLAGIPAYVLWKIPMYLGFARRGTPQDWIRTR
jgi:cellulose synthase/poly-beta-1,6-N-acetylglucosamine synthase-like glycosyltransferase